MTLYCVLLPAFVYSLVSSTIPASDSEIILDQTELKKHEYLLVLIEKF